MAGPWGLSLFKAQSMPTALRPALPSSFVSLADPQHNSTAPGLALAVGGLEEDSAKLILSVTLMPTLLDENLMFSKGSRNFPFILVCLAASFFSNTWLHLLTLYLASDNRFFKSLCLCTSSLLIDSVAFTSSDDPQDNVVPSESEAPLCKTSSLPVSTEPSSAKIVTASVRSAGVSPAIPDNSVVDNDKETGTSKHCCSDSPESYPSRYIQSLQTDSNISAPVVETESCSPASAKTAVAPKTDETLSSPSLATLAAFDTRCSPELHSLPECSHFLFGQLRAPWL